MFSKGLAINRPRHDCCKGKQTFHVNESDLFVINILFPQQLHRWFPKPLWKASTSYYENSKAATQHLFHSVLALW